MSYKPMTFTKAPLIKPTKLKKEPDEDFGLVMPEDKPKIEPKQEKLDLSESPEAEKERKEKEEKEVPVFTKSEIDEKAEELKRAAELPKKPGRKVTFAELKQWFQLLTKEQEDRILVYVYRSSPSIVRQKSNPENPNSIDVIGGNFKNLTEDYFLRTQGGGKYKLYVRDVLQKKAEKGEATFMECLIDIPLSVAKPKMAHIDGCGLDLVEVVWDDLYNQGFREWARANGYLSNDNKPMVPNSIAGGNQPVAPNVELTQMFKMMMDFVGKMSEKDQQAIKKQIGGEEALTKSMGDLMLEKMKQEDPNKQMQSMVALITAVTANQKTGGDTIGPIMTMFTTFMSSMMEQSNKTFQMMMTMMTKQNSGNGDGEKEGELDKLRAIIELSKEIKGGGAAAQMTTADRVVEAISGLAVPVISLVGNIVQANTLAKSGKAIPVNAENGVAPPMNSMEAVSRANMEAMMQPRQPPPPQQQPQQGGDEMLVILRQFAPIIFMNMSKKGWEFAEWIEEGYGATVVAMIIKDGPESILQRAKQIGIVMIPQAGGMVDFWQTVMTTYGEVYLRKWLHDFCNYKDILENMEVENADDPAVQ